jgi:copper chaperone NosL
MKNLSLPARIIVGIASLSIISVLFLPIWKIILEAPQYPEGLEMKIWHNGLSGDVEIINGLNHYIGMKHIKVEMFPEFTYLAYAFGALIVLGLLVALWGRKSGLLTYIVLVLVSNALALYDFWAWGYDYGHNLDPSAAIVVPGMAYQPPLIGHKSLLNFDAWSIPDIGGWIWGAAEAVIIAVCVFECFFKRTRNIQSPNIKTKTPSVKTPQLAVFALFSLFLNSCSTDSEPINYGKDNCHFCKMTISDKKFGFEIITQKGKVYKFDDMNCLVNFRKMAEASDEKSAKILAVDYAEGNGNFIDATKATYLRSPDVRTPMASGFVAFSSKEKQQSCCAALTGDVMNWEEALAYLKR